MRKILSTTFKLIVALLLVSAVFGAGFSPAGHAAAACSPNVTFDLYAKTGSATLYGSTSVNIWGYSLTSGGTPTLPGPTLTVAQGDCVQVTLHNTLSETTGLNFQGQSMVPDLTGAVSGGTMVYTFSATNPGTFMYEAGLIPGTQYQVAMGMYGTLIITSSVAGTAYGSSTTAFDAENTLVLSEVDPALNNSASPDLFDMRNYAPKYFLINGKAYSNPFTGDIPVTAGNTVLLRYVNAGLQSHAMASLGLSQKVVATDGFAFDHPHTMVAETIATGQTLDTLVTIPDAAANGTKYPVYDANLMLRNTSSSGLGGMLTFLTVGATVTPADTGPFVTVMSLSPSSTNGSVPVVVNATISDAGTATVNNIVAAEFYIDSTAGTANAMAAVDAAFDSATEAVTGTISTATLAGLSSGNHTIYVRGKDSNNTWSAFLPSTLNLDKTGPITSGLSLTPNPSSGAVAVALAATGNDTTTGNSNVTAAEYWVDGGVHEPMTPSGSASPTRSFTASIPAGLSMGNHTVSVRSQDAFGNWGIVSTITLKVADTAAPTTSNVVASPNPNNGSMPFNTSVPAVRVTASFSDVATGNSNLAAAEGFIDTVGTTGTGFVFIATDGTFNTPAETGYSDIPLAVVGTLTPGNHTIYVHAKDAAGNWGVMATTVFVIDRTPPTIVSITRVTGTPTNTASVQWLVTFSEAVTGVTASNFNLTETLSGITSSTPVTVAGSGATRTVTAPTGSGNGTIQLNLISATNIKDLATNAMTSAGLPFAGEIYTLDRTRPTVSSVSRVNPNPTNLASVQFTVTFSEAVTGGTASNFSLTTSGSVSGASVTGVSGSGNTRTVTVNTGSGSGTIRLNTANGTGITDLAGNTLNGTFPVSGGTSGTYTIDKAAPTVSSIVRFNPTNATTTASSVQFRVTFSESVSGVTASNFALTLGGTYSVPPSIGAVTGSGTTWTITVNTGTNSGAGTHTIRLDMVNSSGVTDLAGNSVTNVPYTSGQSYTKN